MIKPTDLRIGNYVTVDNQESCPELKEIPLEVVGINKTEGFDKGVWTYNVDLNYIDERKNIVIPAHSQFIEFIKPIPLIEDILVKCRFKKIIINTTQVFSLSIRTDNGAIPKHLWINIMPFHASSIMKYMFCVRLKHDMFEEDNSISLCNIYYLHELQNLFYDLTKTELNVQL